MPIPIKYTTTNVSSSVRLGNIALGVNAVDYGPSSTTNWTNGVSPLNGGYAIYYLSGTNIRMRTAADDATLITVAGQIMGTTYGSKAAALSGLAAGGCTVIYTNPPNLVTSGSVFNLDSGLVMSYPQINTTWYDISGNANNSTLTNGPTFDSTTNSIVFDGTNDYVNGPAISSQFTGDMTAEGWFKVTAGSSDWVRVIGTGGNAGNRTFGLWYNSPNNYILWQRFGGQDPSILITQPLTNGKWYYFAATTIGNAHVLYLNNQVMGTATASGPWPASGENITMGYAGFHAYINGNISRGRLYTRGLSTSEINQNYYQGNIVTSSLVLALDAGNLVSYPGSGTTWTSLTGSISGTLTNGPTFSSANGGAIVFDGTDDYINNIGTTSTFSFIQNTGVYTISAWIKPSVLGTAMYFAGNNSGTSGEKGFYFGKQATNDCWFVITNGSGIILNHSVSNFFLNTTDWVNVTCVGNGTTNQFYKNGIVFGSTSNISNLTTGNSTQTLALGSINNVAAYSYWWSGNIANFQIYNRALSASEVQQNFNAYKNRFNL